MASLLLGKCAATAKKNIVRLLIPQLKFDSFLNKHFRETDDLMAHDPTNNCKPGDWVLARKLPEQFSLGIDYRIEKIVYESGNIIDPLTGKKTTGYENVEDFDKIAQAFGQKPNLQR